ncbi:MAG: hypothetical protein EOP48_07730 [Sphingobacteriales bacterium]|nr:MAG: hypothetical protein EOP48_07730 [Sphingobacteriales bacterium]
MLLFNPISPQSRNGVIINSNNSEGSAGSTYNGMTDNTRFSFVIPLPGVVSALSSYFPLHSSSLEYEFVMDSPANYTRQFVTAAATTPTVTLTNLELVFQSVRFEGAEFAQVMSNTPMQNGMIALKSSTWMYSSSIIPASSAAGRLDLLYPVQAKSIKRIVMWSSPSDSPGRLQ